MKYLGQTVAALTLCAGSLGAEGFSIDIDPDVVERLDGKRMIRDLDVGASGHINSMWGCILDGALHLPDYMEIVETRDYDDLRYSVTRLSLTEVSVEITATEHASTQDIRQDASFMDFGECSDRDSSTKRRSEDLRVLSVNGTTSLSALFETSPFAGHLNF